MRVQKETDNDKATEKSGSGGLREDAGGDVRGGRNGVGGGAAAAKAGQLP